MFAPDLPEKSENNVNAISFFPSPPPLAPSLPRVEVHTLLLLFFFLSPSAPVATNCWGCWTATTLGPAVPKTVATAFPPCVATEVGVPTITCVGPHELTAINCGWP